MNRSFIALAFVCGAAMAHAEEMKIGGAYVPEAPPGVMSHAAFLTLENTGSVTRSLVGVSAAGYAMTHLHESKETNGVASMSMVHQLDIAAGQTVALEPGGFHIMLMHPKGMKAVGDIVPLVLSFANGEKITVEATIRERVGGS